MYTYRITLSPKSPFGTKLVSGTLWGHLAWAIQYLQGEHGFTQWFEEQRADPWLVSSGMPFGFLPRPLLRASLPLRTPGSLDDMQREKRAGKMAIIPEELFLELRGKMSERALRDSLAESESQVPREWLYQEDGFRVHNHIDRLTGTTPDTGGLYFEDAVFPFQEALYQVFVQTRQPCKERLQSLFSFIGQQGFGCNASTGSGHFESTVAEEEYLFQGNGSRAMSLSHGVVSQNMAEPRYRQHVHFGKLGGHYAKGAYSPFKYPILMAQPGATFDLEEPGPYGRLLTSVHHDPKLSHIQHYAMHLALPFTEVES